MTDLQKEAYRMVLNGSFQFEEHQKNDELKEYGVNLEQDITVMLSTLKHMFKLMGEEERGKSQIAS